MALARVRALFQQDRLSVIGGIIGLVLAAGGVHALGLAMRDAGLPYWVVFDADYVVSGYVAATCVATALVSGLGPAMYASRSGGDAVKASGRGSTPSSRVRRFGTAIVVTELTLTTTLLVGAGRSVVRR